MLFCQPFRINLFKLERDFDLGLHVLRVLVSNLFAFLVDTIWFKIKPKLFDFNDLRFFLEIYVSLLLGFLRSFMKLI